MTLGRLGEWVEEGEAVQNIPIHQQLKVPAREVGSDSYEPRLNAAHFITRPSVSAETSSK